MLFLSLKIRNSENEEKAENSLHGFNREKNKISTAFSIRVGEK